MLRLGRHDSVLVPCPAVFAGYMPQQLTYYYLITKLSSAAAQ